jgi:hypothetical protein
MALVDVEVVDAQGRRCPTALNTLNFALTGPAQWRGGIAQGPGNFILSKTLPVEGGVNRVIVRSTPQAGQITVTASSDGLKTATLTLASKPVPTTDGLSPVLPDLGLKSPLDRGPTPGGQAFIMTRQPVKIASVKAGSNAEQAARTFDDDETTSWTNDDTRANGWIQFGLEKPAMVNQITLKLGGWRTKSYPIRVTVDGKEVWSGNTPQSLGYVTLPLAPTTGKTVGIELIGAPVNRDAFGNIVELENQANAATTGGQNTARGNLNIVEAEIYAPISK